MRRFGETLVHVYLFIALVNGAMGLVDVVSNILGWQQTWFTVFSGLFAMILFVATFFFVALFRHYKAPHVYYILPLYYVLSYATLSVFALIISLKGIAWAWIPTFFLSVAFLSSSFEIIFASAMLGRISSLKRNVKKGVHKLSL